MADYSYIGKGQIYCGVLSNNIPQGLFPIGNVSKLSLAVSEESKELQDYTSPGGGLQNKITRIKDITASMTLHDLSGENIALALRGLANTISAGAVSKEVVIGYRGGLVPTAFIPDLTQTITLTNAAEDVTYTRTGETPDYLLTRIGILITPNSTITNGQSLKITYTKKAGVGIEALVNAGAEYRLVFDGLNEAQSGKPVNLTLYRLKFSPSGLDVIGDDFGKLDISGAVLQNSAIQGVGISQYLKMMLVD